jgi:enoyl-CoA hydratase
MSESGIKTEVEGRVAIVTIARERRRNSVDNAALQGLIDAFESLRGTDVSVAILAGEGTKAFSAGSDLKALAAYSEREARHHTHLFLKCAETIDEAPIATIAAIEGYCLGGGLELALACDYRVASRDSSFGFPEITVGALPSGGGTVRAPRAVGLSLAREMLIFGKPIDALRARAVGLVSEVVDAGGTLAAARAFAADYAAKVDPATIGLLKHVIMSGYGASTRTGQTLAYLADYALVQSESFKAGVGGFAQHGAKGEKTEKGEKK